MLTPGRYVGAEEVEDMKDDEAVWREDAAAGCRTERAVRRVAEAGKGHSLKPGGLGLWQVSEVMAQEIALGHLGELRKGVDFGCHQEGSGTPVVRVKDFGDRLFVPHCDLDELDDSQIAIPKSQLLQKDDIVIIRSNGNSERLGLSMIYRGPAQAARAATFSGCCIRFRPDTKRIDPLFAAYFLRSPTCRQRLAAFGCGTGIQNLSQRILSELPVPLPPLGQQKAIAHVLSTLDNKIELNRRMNETLEAIVTAIFKSWFVDFDPVRPRPKAATAGLPKSIADLFPRSPCRIGIGPNSRRLAGATNSRGHRRSLRWSTRYAAGKRGGASVLGNQEPHGNPT